MIQRRFKSITNSAQWFARQSRDPFVKQKYKYDFRSRAAFKLQEIQKKFSIINQNDAVLDLGCSPGGWMQVTSNFTKHVVGVDIVDMEEIPGTMFIKGDITDAQILSMVRQSFPNGIDVLLSDMAHSFSGFASVDVPKVHSLVEFALQVGCLPGMMKSNSNFVAKYLNGAGFDELKELIESRFEKTYCYKPKACRAESREAYIIGMGFKL